MTTKAETRVTQIHQVYIKASAEAIWDAITKPEWTKRYGYQGAVEYDLRPGGKYRGLATDEMRAMGAPEAVVDGEVLEADPPRKLVQTWRFTWDPGFRAEGFTKVTWEIAEAAPGLSKLTVTHELDGAPKTAAMVLGTGPLEAGGGGWPWILSDLKTLLETGKAMGF